MKTDLLAILSPLLNSTGPEFLQFFLSACVLMFLVAACLRHVLRLPGTSSGRVVPNLTPYEVAYLAGGEERTIDAAITNLYNAGSIQVNSSEPRLIRPGRRPPDDAHPLERAIYASLPTDVSLTGSLFRRTLTPVLNVFEGRLQRFGLLVAKAERRKIIALPFLVAMVVPALGAVKIAIGLSRDKPVGALVHLCILSFVVALFSFGRLPHRSRLGDSALETLKTRHQDLSTYPINYTRTSPEGTLPLAIGLFGTGVLEHTALADVNAILSLRSRNTSSASGGGWGGCGGCGGCGG